MLGDRCLSIPTVMARLEGRVENRGGRRHYVRVAVTASPDGYIARVAGGQGSGVLSTLAKANGLLVIPETLPAAEDGALLPVQMLDWDLGLSPDQSPAERDCRHSLHAVHQWRVYIQSLTFCDRATPGTTGERRGKRGLGVCWCARNRHRRT